MTDTIRSPFFYVGDKYKLMKQLGHLFPNDINTFIEPFVGGGSVFLNTQANKYIVNDIEKNIIDLHKLFFDHKNDKDDLLNNLFNLVHKYDLSCSFLGKTVPQDLKDKHVKTYYAKFNKENYVKMRYDYNNTYDVNILYLLLVYGFNHMIRFNKKNEFNLPVGNVDFNNNVYSAILNYLSFVSEADIDYHSNDYITFINSLNIQNNDFLYFDPPYILSSSEYNKLWNQENEKELYNILDALDKNGFKFGLSNLLVSKGVKNDILSQWMDKYKVYEIKSNYISYYDNTIKSSNKEVYVTNYAKSTI